jgi:hypothetical protein
MCAFWSDAFPTTGTETSVDSSLPEWYQNYLQQLTGKAAAIADQPTEAYPGQRIAGFTPMQEQAFGMAGQQAGQWQPGMQQAQQLAMGSAKYDPGALSQFMNPYQSGVVDEIARLGNQNFTENLMPAANAAFTGAGQFGSSRNQQQVGRTARDVQANITGAQAQALNQGFNTANANYLNWAKQGLGGSEQLSNLAKAQQGLGYGDVGALSTLGGAQQQLGQQNLDWAYDQFQQQQQQPTQNLSMLNSIIRGLQVQPQTSTKTTQNVGPNPQGSLGSQVAGGLSSLAGYFQ